MNLIYWVKTILGMTEDRTRVFRESPRIIPEHKPILTKAQLRARRRRDIAWYSKKANRGK